MIDKEDFKEIEGARIIGFKEDAYNGKSWLFLDNGKQIYFCQGLYGDSYVHVDEQGPTPQSPPPLPEQL